MSDVNDEEELVQLLRDVFGVASVTMFALALIVFFFMVVWL